MAIAMIMSRDRLEQEQAMLHRLVVGLLDDGDQVLRVVPKTETDEFSHDEHTVSFSKRIEVPMPISKLLRKGRRENTAEVFKKNDVTTIVSYGRDATQLALDVSNELEVQVMVEVASMKEATKIRKKTPVWRWLAASPSIEQVVANRVGEDRVALVPLGITNHQSKQTKPENANQCVVILDAVGDIKNTREILTSLQKYPNIHIFIEMIGNKARSLWKQIGQLEMHNRVTCLRDVSALRTLIVQSDLVILPSKTMPIRTVLLEAMLCEIPVLATNIPGFDMLVDEESALIVKDSWESSIALLLEDSTFANRIGANGSALVQQKYGSAAQIAAFEAAFTLI
jgi:hypothetical protein